MFGRKTAIRNAEVFAAADANVVNMLITTGLLRLAYGSHVSRRRMEANVAHSMRMQEYYSTLAEQFEKTIQTLPGRSGSRTAQDV